ncbi:S-phase kinase-associated protein 2 [Periophthalmus magnuspinnatus]|uniref:S-phase kinase-associated protein 2 n=1 Tax=Periophthalmus magnuspinnatus TaxID=409849 RepID=UPI00145B5107|nr:S-phase kinase-associated protein 2 [Periophthalmus magnuspinnatus]
MSRNSMSLDDMPLSSVQGSLLHPTKRGNKRKYMTCSSDGLECTPTDCIQHCSPRPTQRLLSRGKENEDNLFVIARRPRRKRELVSGLSWDHLPDELLLKIFFYLPLQELLKMASVCKRWHRLVFDESLWHSVDLEGLTHMGPALQHILKNGVRRLRCPRAFVEELQFTSSRPLQLIQMDLSSSIIPVAALEGIIASCTQLQDLSLEGLQLSDTVIHSLAKNGNLEQLNISGCSGFSSGALEGMLKSCQRILQLNISWCDFISDHVKSVVHNVSPCVTHLNLSGYRENLTLEDIKVLVSRCQKIHILDLSDSTLLMADSFPVLAQLKYLLHLSLSRCYHIHPAALSDLAKKIPSLVMLDVFGLINDSHLPALKKEMPHISINSRLFSTIARPTPAERAVGHNSDCTMWNQRCRLRVRL